MSTYAIAIHGGANPRIEDTDTAEKHEACRAALQHALRAGSRILEKGGDSLDAVEQAVNALEDCPLFNAGKGAVYTADGTHELDASIMEGQSLNAGAVAQLRGIKNPVSLARDVMEKSEHVFLAAGGAIEFAQHMGYDLVEAEYFVAAARHEEWQASQIAQAEGENSGEPGDKKLGTVGAVACDTAGNLAAATSTGGMLNKRYGRIGDSPIIGSGNYANNKTCAVSCTGSGEFFIRGVVAYDVACLIEHKGLSLQAAADEVIHKRILEINGDGGLIAVDARGHIAMPFNTKRMYRACVAADGPEEIYV